MHRIVLSLLLVSIALATFGAPSVVDLNTPREFPAITNRAQWETRAKDIREQILVSAGLWPMPEKTPLHAKIFGKIVRDGYSVEKVYFEALPGFYVGGNLYRPVGHGNGPFPAVLAPHGHWENGRMVNDKSASYAGLCINFARQGIVAFSYDMVGYNDTHFADSPTNQPFYKMHRSFETNDPAALLWGVSLMGLQTWDSIRAVDFLESLPDVDSRRIGCTGASGGGTQTMLLGAVDGRIAALAPVVMVSHTMQGGCLCENMPGLRVEYSNMEIAAAAAPRPQIIVGASGDWTKTTLTVEGPAVAHIYDLLQAPDNLRYVRFDFPHNYNQTSREAVYQWFDKTLLKGPDEAVKEIAFQKEPDTDLRVFPDGKLPSNALTQAKLVNELIDMHRRQLQSIQPKDASSLEHYKTTMAVAYARTMQLPKMDEGEITVQHYPQPNPLRYLVSKLAVPFDGESKITLHRFVPVNTPVSTVRMLLVDANESKSFVNEANEPIGLAEALLGRQIEVFVLENVWERPATNQLSIFYSTYNRTLAQEMTARLATVCARIRDWDNHISLPLRTKVILCGTGRAGLWCLLAAPSAQGVIADCDGLDMSNDQNFLAPDLFCPGLRNLDTFNGALILAAPHPLLLHNTADKCPGDRIKSAYKILRASKKVRVEKKKLTDEQIVEWITKLR